MRVLALTLAFSTSVAYGGTIEPAWMEPEVGNFNPPSFSIDWPDHTEGARNHWDDDLPGGCSILGWNGAFGEWIAFRRENNCTTSKPVHVVNPPVETPAPIPLPPSIFMLAVALLFLKWRAV